MPAPQLIDILPRAMLHMRAPNGPLGVTLEGLRVYTRLDGDDLHYCVTWGNGRYIAGVLTPWPDIQRIASENGDLTDYFDELGGDIIQGDEGIDQSSEEMTAGSNPARQRNVTANHRGGRALARANPDPREGLEEEPREPPPEPKRAIDRIIDGDLKLSGDE